MKKPPRMATDLLLLTLPAVLAIAMGSARHHAAPAAQVRAPADAALLARGKNVAEAAHCARCHTAPNGGAPFAGGLRMVSPLGPVEASNITPDPRYGIGRYTYEDFDRAVRRGVAPGGKVLNPAMPYPEFSKMSDNDLRALYAYLMQRVAPVAKPTEPPEPTDVASSQHPPPYPS
ncbi:c-type cytochrome [Trinickia acidisoli]|uniref:c-type cytochrome n=1 Tax=Trinickia acidisoli TaxID=2767482 RepID=UPI0035AB94BF